MRRGRIREGFLALPWLKKAVLRHSFFLPCEYRSLVGPLAIANACIEIRGIG
jgi:hypothetical protein